MKILILIMTAIAIGMCAFQAGYTKGSHDAFRQCDYTQRQTEWVNVQRIIRQLERAEESINFRLQKEDSLITEYNRSMMMVGDGKRF